MITKKALAAAMKELMQNVDFGKITVGDICAHCGISRKAFYYHFKDKYDIVNWIYFTEFIDIIQQQSYTDAWAFLYEACRYFYNNRKFYINAFSVKGQNSFTDYFSETLEVIASEYIQEQISDLENCDFYCVFFTDAFRTAIIRWLKEDAQLQPENFIALIKNASLGLAKLTAKHPDDDA
jgi:probable dihydroxyacetone kinase regulator